MNNQEAAALCRLAQACCPQQKFDEFTPDAWAGLLDDIRFEDARIALRDVAKTQPFVSPAEIRARVKVIREQRLAAAPPLDPPPEAAEDEAAYRRWLANFRRAVADGEALPAAPELPGRPMKQIEGTFRSIPPNDLKDRYRAARALSTPIQEGHTP